MERIMALAAGAFALAGCSREEEPDPPPQAAASAASEPSPTNGEDGARAFRHTSLASCEVVREEHEEMPYLETLCPGPAGWALRITDSDARQNLFVVAPGGAETNLELSRIGGGGFSSLGETAEWRGAQQEPFVPDSLIVRYQVAEAPYPEPETSYLLAVDLEPRPCVVGTVAPGPGQNAAARTSADDPGACLAGRSLR